MSTRSKALFIASAIFTCASMKADFLIISQPTTGYVNGTTLLDFADPDSTSVGALSGGGETLTYDDQIEERSVPASWPTWGAWPAVETSTPRVGYTEGLPELTIMLSHAATTFGFELEPDVYTSEETTADFYSGTKLVGTIDLSPNGSAGALLFAASTSTNPFTSVVINNLDDDDFAIARQRFTLAASDVPEPATSGLLGAAMAGLFFLKRRRR